MRAISMLPSSGPAAVCGSVTSSALPPFPLNRRSPLADTRQLPLSSRPSATSLGNELSAIRISRRMSSSVLFLIPFLLSSSSSASSSPELRRYADEAQGFVLLIPSSWVQVEKAGATALFQEGKGSNNIGVVVNPVRIASLEEFGTPEFVADKLIQAERRKESTKQAEVVNVAKRTGSGGLPIYEFEYTVDSTRGGMKRIFSAAFVASKKIYLLSITYSDRPESPLDNEMRMVLEEVLHSFDTA